jgi:hypothetical protein
MEASRWDDIEDLIAMALFGNVDKVQQIVKDEVEADRKADGGEAQGIEDAFRNTLSRCVALGCREATCVVPQSSDAFI